MDFFSRLSSLRVHRRNGDRAPHKPLYLLYLLSCVDRGEPRMRPFQDVQFKLAKAIKRFGKNTQSVHPEYPFWRIQNDGLGEVTPGDWEESEFRGGEKEPKISALRSRQACGGLLLGDYDHLVSNSERTRLACHQILDDHFPISLHEEIMYFFGFSFGKGQAAMMGGELGRMRQKAFGAYDHRCAISEFNGSPSLSMRGSSSPRSCGSITEAQCRSQISW